MTVRVSVTGRLAVEHDDGRVEGGPLLVRRTRLLLVSLASADGTLSAAVLADRLWTTPPPTWSAALRGAVAALRASLAPAGLGGQQLVVTDPAGWHVAPGTVTDLSVAEQDVVRAEAALSRGDATTALAAASTAAAACAGEVLPEDDGDWIDVLRDRRAGTRARALAAVTDAAMLLGDATAAAGAARALLEERPLDETAHRRLIRACLAAGDRPAAILAFERCRALLATELGLDPDDETAALYLQVLQSGSASGRAPRLPEDRFVGRGAELGRLLDALARTRWVTLVGPGGIGKSRLALHAVHDPAVAAAGTRYWANLGALTDPDLVASAVASAVGVEGAPDPLRGVVDRLAPAGPALLVLDGCERYLDLVAETVALLLEQIPGLVVLCTSRRRLGGTAERRIAVGPLDAGVALLAARLAEGPSMRRMTHQDEVAARELCRRVGGVPLAIELLAARLQDLALGDVLDETAEHDGDAGSVLAALVDQAYDALDPQEARLLRALAAVDGTLPLTLVRATVERHLPPPRVARVLGALSDAGLVVVDRDGVRWRYGVDGHLRDLARSKATPQELRDALASICDSLDDVVPVDATAPPGPWRTGVDAALDGLRAVFAASADGTLPRAPALQLAFRLHRHWAASGVAEGRFWLGRLLDGAPPSPEASRARFAAGYLAYWAGDANGLAQLRRAGAELQELEPAFAARALLYAAGLSDDLDQPALAVAEITTAVALARRAGGGLVASVELGFASVLAERGDPAAVRAVDDAVALLPEGSPPGQRAAMAATGALAAWRAGDREATARLIRDASALLEDAPSISRAVLAMAQAGDALVLGDPARARDRAALALADLRGIGADREVPLAATLATRAAAELGDAGGARTHARLALTAARDLDLPAAAALALEAVLVADPDHPAAAVLAASAARLRASGDRPAPPGLEPVRQHRPAEPLDVRAALRLAAG